MLRSVKIFSPQSRRAAEKILKTFLFTLCTFSFFSAVCCEEWKSPDSDVSLGHFPAKIVSDLSNLFSADSVPPFFIGTMATAFDWGAYDSKNTLAGDLGKLELKSLFDFGNFYGEGWVEGGLALGSWSLGGALNDLTIQSFGRDATESILLSTILVTGLKVSVNRTRPDGGQYSFPSGHSIMAFCIAPVVQKYWGWGAGVPAYALATVTAFARVEGYHHYLSDVIAGAALGIILGNAVVYTPKDVSVSVGMGELNLKLAFN